MHLKVSKDVIDWYNMNLLHTSILDSAPNFKFCATKIKFSHSQSIVCLACFHAPAARWFAKLHQHLINLFHSNSPRQSPKSRRISRSGSVPNLTSSQSLNVNSAQLSPSYRKKLVLGQGSHHHHHQQHHHRHGHQGRHLPNHKTNRISSSLINRASRESTNSLLHPGMLQYHRHALSVDETGPYFRSSVTPHDSQSSMIIPDSHEARIRDRTFRSDTAKKHVLARQKPIEKEEPHSPKTAYTNGRR